MLAGNQTLLASIYLTPLLLVDGVPDFGVASHHGVALRDGAGPAGQRCGVPDLLLAASTLHPTQVSMVTYSGTGGRGVLGLDSNE